MSTDVGRRGCALNGTKQSQIQSSNHKGGWGYPKSPCKHTAVRGEGRPTGERGSSGWGSGRTGG